MYLQLIDKILRYATSIALISTFLYYRFVTNDINTVYKWGFFIFAINMFLDGLLKGYVEFKANPEKYGKKD